MLWAPITKNELQDIIDQQLSECTHDLIAIFNEYRVPLILAPIVRYENVEGVFVVARKNNNVLYFEDVEEGFNFSPINEEGLILEHWCNQDSLRFALQKWLSNN